jgi:hypothetical protein
MMRESRTLTIVGARFKGRGCSAATTSALALLLLAAPLQAQTAASGAADDRWHFAVAPYFWAAGISGTASFKGIPEQPVEASFSDVIKHFDIGFASRFEARKGRWGLATDVLYMNLGATIPAGDVLGRFEPDVDLRQLVSEADAVYRAYHGRQAEGVPAFFDVLVGARYNGMRVQLKGSEFEGTRRTFEWVDGVVGIRFQASLGRKVTLAGRGDIAGFGSDFTWQLQGDLTFHLSPRSALSGGYRYYDVDYDKGSGLDRKVYKIATKGPVVAFVYGW